MEAKLMKIRNFLFSMMLFVPVLMLMAGMSVFSQTVTREQMEARAEAALR